MPEASLEQVVSAILEVRQTMGGNLGKVTSKLVSNKLAGQQLTLDMRVYGQAQTYVKGIPTAQAAVVKTLDAPLTELFVKGSRSFPPMRRWDLGLKVKIEDAMPSSDWVIQEAMLTRLMTALCHSEVQGLLDTTLAKGITIKQFLKSGPEGQLKTINALWDECTTKGVYDTTQSAMVDNTNPVDERGTQLPSSIHPVRGSGGSASTFKAGRGGKPFHDLGAGFRVEGSGTAEKIQWHVNRVKKDGMSPQVTLPTLMLDNGYDVSGTVVSTGVLAPRLNVTQKDLWNESGVCVARSFFGATAFPYRWTEGTVILWALDVNGLTGFDTEAYQLGNKKGNGPWRPGEKCFGRIEASRVLGWVLVEKLGNKNGGWEFKIAKDAQWGQTAAPGTAEQRKYIDEELAAWRDTTASASTMYDFAALV